jgi:isopentenyl-diphosphate Delta-isomerase
MDEDQTLLVVDDQGKFTGEYESKLVCHTGAGKHHLAITVFIYNSNGDILIHQRKHQIFDKFWDNTGSTHQLHRKDGTDETDEEATNRCLKVEWGIEGVKLKNLGGFNYFEKIDGFCENEHCKLLTGEFNGEVNMNPETGYEYKWMARREFLKDILDNPKKYTPWCKAAVGILQSRGFFD